MMKGQLAGLMKQAQQMQENMKKMQEQLALIEVEGQSGAGLVKVTMGEGHSRYVVPDRPSPVDVLRRLRHAAAEYVLSVDAGEDLVVIHTLTGRANAVAAAIDEMRWDDLVGTVAGDDTILVVPRRRAVRDTLMLRFRRLIEGRPV